MYFSYSPGHDVELHAYLCISVSPNGILVTQTRGLCPIRKKLGILSGAQDRDVCFWQVDVREGMMVSGENL